MPEIKRKSKIPLIGRKAPSLVDLCVSVAVSHVRYLGDVGETDLHLLDRILPHCTLDQLMHIENSTQERDLSPVTDKLWKKFYERQFGEGEVNNAIERMRRSKVSFKWIELYKAKVKYMAKKEDEAVARLRQLYKKEDDKKQSRQIQLCTKIPPSSKRSFFGGGGPGCNLSTVKSNIMKKSKVEFLKRSSIQGMEKPLCKMQGNAAKKVQNQFPMKFHFALQNCNKKIGVLKL